MRITKHEAAVLATALNRWEWYDECHVRNQPEDMKNMGDKLQRLLEKLTNYEEDKRLYSTSGRAKSYPSLKEIILTKLK